MFATHTICTIFHVIQSLGTFWISNIASNPIWYSQWIWSKADSVQFMVGSVFISNIFAAFFRFTITYFLTWCMAYCFPDRQRTSFTTFDPSRELENFELESSSWQNVHLIAALRPVIIKEPHFPKNFPLHFLHLQLASSYRSCFHRLIVSEYPRFGRSHNHWQNLPNLPSDTSLSITDAITNPTSLYFPPQKNAKRKS